MHYNAHTDHGFSGGPVFDDQFRWIGLHTKGYSTLSPKQAVEQQRKFRDFDRPNGGHLLRNILYDLKSRVDTNTPPPWLEKTDLLKTLLALPLIPTRQ